MELLEAEVPEDPELAPQTLEDWSTIYVRYLQILRKIEEAYDALVHPQKRIDLHQTLAAVTGRLLEVRDWLVGLNEGIDEVPLLNAVADLKLLPDALEVPVPRLFVQENAGPIADKRTLLEAVLDDKAAADGKPRPPLVAPNLAPQKRPLDLNEAIKTIKTNEWARQARERFVALRIEVNMRRMDKERESQGLPPPNRAEAATLMQTALRAFAARRRADKMRHEEQLFLGMMSSSGQTEHEAKLKDKLERGATYRKALQRDNQEEYEEALRVLRVRVKEMEGQDMRETVQDAINAWFVDGRTPEGTYPEFPDEEDGGSTLILNPPPAPLEEPEGDGKDKKAAAAAKGKDKGKSAEPVVKEMKSEFIADIEQSVKKFIDRWQDRDESGNFSQKYDPELVKEQLRPLVFEEVRVEVDEEMRSLLENLVDMVEAEKAAQRGAKWKKKKKKKKKKKGKKDKKKGKKYKDLTADRDPLSIYSELAACGIIRPYPLVPLTDYQGTLEPTPGVQEPSMDQVRQLVTEYCVLPIGTQLVHEKAPHNKAVLLYGCPGTGKTLLTHAIATATGATLIDLSPTVTSGQYKSKQDISRMVHMGFKMARLYAPSIILIDHVEKVLAADKKLQRAWNEQYSFEDPCGRIKKDLAKEMKVNVKGDQVLVLGCTSQPQVVVKKDKKALMNFFTKHIHVPLPSYASRVHLWPHMFTKHGGTLHHTFDLPMLAKLTEGYSSGDMDKIAGAICTPERLGRLEKGEEIEFTEVLTWMTVVAPVDPLVPEAVRTWTSELPARVKKPAVAADPKKKK